MRADYAVKKYWVYVIAGAITLATGIFLERFKVPADPPGETVAAETKDKSSPEIPIIAKEREGLDALKAGNLKAFGKLMANDAIFVDAAGPASKGEVLRNVEGFHLADYSMDWINFRELTNKSGLISYRLTESGNSHGKDFSTVAYVTSIWSERSGNLVCVFSQETKVK